MILNLLIIPATSLYPNEHDASIYINIITMPLYTIIPVATQPPPTGEWIVGVSPPTGGGVSPQPMMSSSTHAPAISGDYHTDPLQIMLDWVEYNNHPSSP